MARTYGFILKIEAVLAGALLLLMVGLIFTGGVARMMAHPLNWTIDLATCCFAWACFLCADIAWRNDALMSFDLVTARTPLGLQRLIVFANYLILAAFLIYVIYAGIWLSWISRERSVQGIPDVSDSWGTMSLPVGRRCS